MEKTQLKKILFNIIYTILCLFRNISNATLIYCWIIQWLAQETLMRLIPVA